MEFMCMSTETLARAQRQQETIIILTRKIMAEFMMMNDI